MNQRGPGRKSLRNRTSLLGRSRPNDRLSHQEREALERAPDAGPPEPRQSRAKSPPAGTAQAPQAQAEPASNTGRKAHIPRSALNYHWTAQCPACGHKITGNRSPEPGQRLARCGRCKLNIHLKDGK